MRTRPDDVARLRGPSDNREKPEMWIACSSYTTGEYRSATAAAAPRMIHATTSRPGRQRRRREEASVWATELILTARIGDTKAIDFVSGFHPNGVTDHSPGSPLRRTLGPRPAFMLGFHPNGVTEPSPGSPLRRTLGP